MENMDYSLQFSRFHQDSLREQKQLFSSKIKYDFVLEKLKESFERRWNTHIRSPHSNLQRFYQIALLGVGSFGRVKLVREVSSNKYFAAKELYKDRIVTKHQVMHVYNEKQVLQSIRFPFLINLEFSTKDNDNLYLGLPICQGGDLFTYHRKVRSFDEKQARFYACQIVLALEYLHAVSVLYRDLKPENIMLDSTGYIKITDFGFAKKVKGRTYTLCGTPEYLSPELIKMKPYGTSVDWWAFGVLLYELVEGFTPFSRYNYNIVHMYSKICDSDFYMPTHFSHSLKNLINDLLIVDVTRRCGCVGNGVKDLKEHEWFKDVDWYGILNFELEPPYIPLIASNEDISNFRPVNYNKLQIYVKSLTDQYTDIFADF